MKKCSKCREAKSPEEFYHDKVARDGLSNRCKICDNMRSKKWAKENPEKRKAKDKECRDKNPERYARKEEWYRIQHPEIKSAHSKARYAVETGRLAHPKYCEQCGDEADLCKHHDDYSKPLEVRWLCYGCHAEVHQETKMA